MSPGDQLVSVIINSVGTLISALINAIFGAFLTPLLEAIATALGLPV